jgi:hypothetical protein
MLVKDINNYKKIKSKNINNEIKEYDNEINKKIEDLKKLESEKYIKLEKATIKDKIRKMRTQYSKLPMSHI